MLISVVIRTLNEQAHLDELLTAVEMQSLPQGCAVECVIVDSGSSDDTLSIAQRHNCRVTHIKKQDFSFGRSLNQGCEFAQGDLLVFISGHCIPVDENWLRDLTRPLVCKQASYCYGRQVGRGPTKFSERRVFLKYFPEVSKIPQEGFFVNNANAAVTRTSWQNLKFDEELTGLEDMHLGKRLTEQGEKLAYVASASVYHIHDETWSQVKNRYEREGMALAKIMPTAAISLYDFFECTFRSIAKDSYAAAKQGKLVQCIYAIVMFRTLQYWGSYRGTTLARTIAKATRRSYFYPDQHFDKPDSEIE